MRSNTRLWMAAVMIMGSAFYAVLITRDPVIASAVALGYVAALLTIFILGEIGKKP